jgi:hypothetical protein
VAFAHDRQEAPVPVIRTFLDLSTAHLPEAVCDRLSAQPGVVAYCTTQGWLMRVPDNPDEHALHSDEPIPDVVLSIQRYARAMDCDYVLFDADADQVGDLPAWQW